MQLDPALTFQDLLPAIDRMWEASARTLDSLEASWTPEQGSPVFTIQGKYTAQGWTEWTQGFQFGSALLQFDGTGEERFLTSGRQRTWELMAPHVSHIGVHDHGFNNISTYGALRRLMLEGKLPRDSAELHFYELALKTSGAVQAARWSRTHENGGYIYSFNGPHSLFADTFRSLRSLAVAHLLGHRLMGENDQPISLLQRLLEHAKTTVDYNVYFGEGRDLYDVSGRVVHESIFNPNDGRYRCPSSQQGYCPFTTWTRGAAWIITGLAEQLEFLNVLSDEELIPFGGRAEIEGWMLRAARATCDYYISESPSDGVPYWDTGAPGLVHLGDYRNRPADPFNDYEPVDSSAAAIAAQGFIRLGRFLDKRGMGGDRYTQAGLVMLKSLLSEPYLNLDPAHQGLLLHSIYHRPRNWDYIPPGSKIPRGEACMWGDYHLRETALYVQRLARNEPDFTFYGPVCADQNR
ncbi:glycosyl hydrolase [Planctomicrobium sp. SH661]|uniref:glycosyl hydrolase n=1 Tax=Planctomicrobium sp. SH661 TaxID=3448124 RepID=UPI003F5C4CA6